VATVTWNRPEGLVDLQKFDYSYDSKQLEERPEKRIWDGFSRYFLFLKKPG